MGRGGSSSLNKECEDMPHLQNGNMAHRHSMGRKHSKRSFTKKALNVKHQNFVSGVMRGGIRF